LLRERWLEGAFASGFYGPVSVFIVTTSPCRDWVIWKCGGGAAAVGGGGGGDIGVTLLAAGYLRYRYLRMMAMS